MNTKRFFVVLLALAIMAECFAQEPEIKPDFGLGGIGLFNLELYGGIQGFELVPGVKSKLLMYAGGGYYGDAYFRDIAGNRIGGPAWDFSDAGFNYWNVHGKLGLDIGIAYSERLKKNWLYSRAYVKSALHSYILKPGDLPLIATTAYPENAGFWETGLFVNLQLDLVEFDKARQTSNGLAAEASVEYAPGLGFNNVFGQADYYRLNVNAAGYKTLLSAENFSLYAGDRFIVDFLGGERIPLYAQRNSGGFTLSPGAGYLVRGIEAGRFDANIKVINNFDVRMPFPTLFGEVVVPELFAFFDAALVDNLDYALSPLSEGLYTTGAGIYINLNIGGMQFDLGYWVSYSILEDRWNFVNYAMGGHHF